MRLLLKHSSPTKLDKKQSQSFFLGGGGGAPAGSAIADIYETVQWYCFWATVHSQHFLFDDLLQALENTKEISTCIYFNQTNPYHFLVILFAGCWGIWCPAMQFRLWSRGQMWIGSGVTCGKRVFRPSPRCEILSANQESCQSVGCQSSRSLEALATESNHGRTSQQTSDENWKSRNRLLDCGVESFGITNCITYMSKWMFPVFFAYVQLFQRRVVPLLLKFHVQIKRHCKPGYKAG